MAPKKAAKSGFWSFAMNWRKKNYPDAGLPEVTKRAGELWATMSASEKKKWDEIAKNGPTTYKKPVEKLTSQGIPISQIEKEQKEIETAKKNMKEKIQDIISNASNTIGLENQKFVFICVNYFTKSIDENVYLPAEISLSEYSLKDGIVREYHAFINPGRLIFGHAFTAKQHTESTHNLPLPPNAMGDTDYDMLYQKILDFVRFSCSNLGESSYPPIYTHKDQIQATESVLEFLKAGKGCKIRLDVFNIHHLFYTLKLATCSLGGIIKPDSSFITDSYFDRDEFEYHVGIGCHFHEEIDRSKYCTKSCVVRWGYMFSDYMCSDLDLDMIPGIHIPKATNCGLTLSTSRSFIDDSRSFHSDTESYASFTSEGTGIVRPKRRIENILSNNIGAIEDNKRKVLADNPQIPKTNSDNFSSIANKVPYQNRWADRTKVQAREPINDTFSGINSTLDESICSSQIIPRVGRRAAILAARSFMSMEDDRSAYENTPDTSMRSCGRGKFFE